VFLVSGTKQLVLNFWYKTRKTPTLVLFLTTSTHQKRAGKFKFIVYFQSRSSSSATSSTASKPDPDEIYEEDEIEPAILSRRPNIRR
jgi:hypothetical protein